MTDTAVLFIDCRSELGEGPFWHPGLRRLFWFDILNKTLFSADAGGHIVDRFTFKDNATAAGVVDKDTLVVATGAAILRFELGDDSSAVLAPIEPDKPGNRSNDGRVHPSGSFWVGTMSRRGATDPGVGAVYLYRDGHAEKLFGGVSIPNSTCFSPDGRIGYFADTVTKTIRQCELDPQTGRPVGEWRDFASTAGHRGSPDGSVVDAEGFLWNARFNGSCVVRHAPDGSIDRVVEVPVPQVTCPAFGGEDLRTLYITTARENLSPEQIERAPLSGSIFSIRVDVPGLPEPVVRL